MGTEENREDENACCHYKEFMEPEAMSTEKALYNQCLLPACNSDLLSRVGVQMLYHEV